MHISNRVLLHYFNVNVNFEAMERDIKDILTGFKHGMLNKSEATEQLLNLHIVSNPLPTKDEIIAEGNNQIEDWLSENSEHDQRVYRVAFRRSYEYVLRFIK